MASAAFPESQISVHSALGPGYPSPAFVPSNGFVPVAKPDPSQFVPLDMVHVDAPAFQVPVAERYQAPEFVDILQTGPHWNHSVSDYPSLGGCASSSNNIHVGPRKIPHEVVPWPAPFPGIHHNSYPIQKPGYQVTDHHARQSSSILKVAVQHDSFLQAWNENRRKEVMDPPSGIPFKQGSVLQVTMPTAQAAQEDISEIRSSLRSQRPIISRDVVTVPAMPSNGISPPHVSLPFVPFVWKLPDSSPLHPRMPQVSNDITAPFAPGFVAAPISATSPASFELSNVKSRMLSINSPSTECPIAVAITSPVTSGRTTSVPLTKVIKKKTHNIRPKDRDRFIGPIAPSSTIVGETPFQGTTRAGTQAGHHPEAASRHLPIAGRDMLLKVRANVASRVPCARENLRWEVEAPGSDQQRTKIRAPPLSSNYYPGDVESPARCIPPVAHSKKSSDQSKIRVLNEGPDSLCRCTRCQRDHRLPRSSSKQHHHQPTNHR